MKNDAIRVGDKFSDGLGHIWEVIRTYPGGRLDMMDRARTRFGFWEHKEVRTWERIA